MQMIHILQRLCKGHGDVLALASLPKHAKLGFDDPRANTGDVLAKAKWCAGCPGLCLERGMHAFLESFEDLVEAVAACAAVAVVLVGCDGGSGG